MFAEYLFSGVATIQVLLTIGLVPALVAVTIAQERERRTLDSLLATRLTSAEIVALSRRKRAVVIVTLIIIVLGITMIVWHERGERSLRDALAETDRLFPAWRLDDSGGRNLEAARQRVPDQKNSALLVSAAAELLPPSRRSAGTGASQRKQKQLGSAWISSRSRLEPPNLADRVSASAHAQDKLPEQRAAKNKQSFRICGEHRRVRGRAGRGTRPPPARAASTPTQSGRRFHSLRHSCLA